MCVYAHVCAGACVCVHERNRVREEVKGRKTVLWGRMSETEFYKVLPRQFLYLPGFQTNSPN